VPNLGEHRIDASTALAADPAVRAAERAIVTGSSAVLADTLAVSTAAEARRRVARVLDLKERAEGDPARRGAYQRAADDLRAWAASVYVAALRHPDDPVARSVALLPGEPREDGVATRSRSTRRAATLSRS
jgi:hypothetical protein